MTVNSVGFRKRLRAAREAAKLTQTELGKAVDMLQGTISEWETGPREPSIDQLGELADALGVTVGFLAAGETSEGFEEGVRTALNMLLRTTQEWVQGARLATEEFRSELTYADRLVRENIPIGREDMAKPNARPGLRRRRAPQPSSKTKQGRRVVRGSEEDQAG